jgi:hypothetical protein
VFKTLDTKIRNNSVNKWAHELNRQFSKKEMQMVNKYMKKYSTALAMKEMQIKNETDYILLQSKWKSSRKQATNAGEAVGRKATLVHC